MLAGFHLKFRWISHHQCLCLLIDESKCEKYWKDEDRKRQCRKKRAFNTALHECNSFGCTESLLLRQKYLQNKHYTLCDMNQIYSVALQNRTNWKFKWQSMYGQTFMLIIRNMVFITLYMKSNKILITQTMMENASGIIHSKQIKMNRYSFKWILCR